MDKEKPITVRYLDDAEVEGAKRQYAPFAIDWVCSKCNQEYTYDFTDWYLSFFVKKTPPFREGMN